MRILSHCTLVVPKSSKTDNYQRVPPLVGAFLRKSIGKTLEELFQNAKISHSDAAVMHILVTAFRHTFLTHSACPVKPQLQNHHFVKDLR